MLIDYLEKNFLLRGEILERASLSADELTGCQQSGLVPQPSYRIEKVVNCNSFFGPHTEVSETLEFYSEGCIEWISIAKDQQDADKVRSVFDDRYLKELDRLKADGFTPEKPSALDNIDEHLNSEWAYFLDGTYGLCTVSGLPKDIAAKELAIIIIKEHIDQGELREMQKQALKKAVDLLDQVSAPFAPHERGRSSRKRLIDDVRLRYDFA